MVLVGCTGGPDVFEPVCPPPPPGAGQVRVRQLACAEDLPTGPFAAGRVGDWVLENAVSRWVVRSGREGHALVGLTGGNLVDAVRVEDGEQLGEDGLRELATAVGFHMLEPDRFVVGADRLEVQGALVPFPLITDILQVPDPGVDVRWEYRLQPDVPVLDAIVHLDGPASLADLWLVRGGQQLFVPGEDPWDLPLTADAAKLGVLTPDPALASAVSTRADVDRTLLFAGPIRVVLHDPTEGTVVRRIALGADHAEADAWFDEPTRTLDNPAGVADAVDGEGQRVSRCQRAVCDVPASTEALVPTWMGDGNGGPSAPGQTGVSASLSIAAPTAFRAVAVRSDGLERTLIDVDGAATFLVPSGAWTVTVMAGPTWTLDTFEVAMAPGEQASITAELTEVVDTTGWSAADLHVHMETSLDSDIPMEHRLRGALAEHLDYVVTTDHDFVATPVVPDGLQVRAAAEVSTMLAGHFNAWPVPADPDAAGGGAPDWRGLGPEALIDVLPGLVQCNHPRFVDGGYAASFDIGLDPARCDLVEVLNGFSPDETPAVLDDLLATWSTGARPVATGASDTHEQDDFIGNPRTWIRETGDADALDAALSAGRAVASAGPFVTLELASGTQVASIGDTLVPDGEVTARIDLQAPDWMPLAQLEVRVDGVAVWSEDLTDLPAIDGLRRRSVEVPVNPQGYVMVVHQGAPAVPPALHAPPDVVTNPVWVE